MQGIGIPGGWWCSLGGALRRFLCPGIRTDWMRGLGIPQSDKPYHVSVQYECVVYVSEVADDGICVVRSIGFCVQVSEQIECGL